MMDHASSEDGSSEESENREAQTTSTSQRRGAAPKHRPGYVPKSELRSRLEQRDAEIAQLRRELDLLKEQVPGATSREGGSEVDPADRSDVGGGVNTNAFFEFLREERRATQEFFKLQQEQTKILKQSVEENSQIFAQTLSEVRESYESAAIA